MQLSTFLLSGWVFYCSLTINKSSPIPNPFPEKMQFMKYNEFFKRAIQRTCLVPFFFLIKKPICSFVNLFGIQMLLTLALK